FGRVSAGDQLAFSLSGLDVSQDGPKRRFVDDGPQVVIGRWIAYRQRCHAFAKALKECAVDRRLHDGTRTGGALLAAVAEGRRNNAFDRGVEIGIGANDDCVFTAHFQNGSLDPDLVGLHTRRSLVDLQSHRLGTGEGDKARLWMRDNGIAKRASRARTKIDHTVWQAGFFKRLDKSKSDSGRIARWLQHYGVPRDDGSGSHAGHDGERKI